MPPKGKRKAKEAGQPPQKRTKATSSSSAKVRLRASSDESDHLEDLDFLSTSASKFKKRDVAFLKVRFKASSKKNVIPDIDEKQYPKEYVLPGIDRKMLINKDFDVDDISELSNKDRDIKTFIDKLHDVVVIGKVVIGTRETVTDTLVDNLLRISGMDKYPLKIINHPLCRLFIEGTSHVWANPEFVVYKRKMAMLVVEDKHLKDVSRITSFGEVQIAAEILTCGDENSRLMEEDGEDQILFVVRVISTYVTFYKVEIPAGYWDELGNGLPKEQSVEILRWPEGNSVDSGLDLADPDERNEVLMALAKIRAFFEEDEDLA